MSGLLARLIRHFLLFINILIFIPDTLSAFEQKSISAKVKLTCFALEKTSNDFGVVDLNFLTNEVRATFYIAGLGENSSTRIMTEYDKQIIANLEKAGCCDPVQKLIRVHGSIKGIEFSDGCLVKDPTQTVFSSRIAYKIDFSRSSGNMSVKNYDGDTKLYSERKYFLYHCFEPGE